MVYGEHIEGGMEPEELQWLCDHAKDMDSVVEIGSWMGRNTFSLCSSGCPHVYAVDPFPKPGDICEGHFFYEDGIRRPFVYRGISRSDQYERYIENVGHFKNLTTLRMRSEDAPDKVPDVDMVFVDGNHYYEFVMQDLRLWTPKTKRLMSGHDYHFSGVKQAVDEFFGNRVKQGPRSIWYVFVDNQAIS